MGSCRSSGTDRSGLNDVEMLLRAVEKAAGCAAAHIGSEDVQETFKGSVIWDGRVELFELHGHPNASRAYAWEDKTKAHEGYVAVLGVDPVKSSLDAVKAYLVNLSNKRN